MTPQVALVLVAFLVAANGLFVAAEFAFVAARRGVIEERAAAGDRRARSALQQLEQLSFALSAAQFGITATSLLVGFLAESAIGDLLVRPVLDALGWSPATQTAIAVTVALLLSTALQMVLGELFPKNLAIARPEVMTLRLAPLMRAFGWAMGPVIRVFDRSAAWVSSRLFRVEVSEELVGGHSLEELSRIIFASGQEGALTEAQTEMLGRAVELGDTRVHELMVPRPDVVFLPEEATLHELREAARETGHSRFPVRGSSEDEIVGTVHVKDVLQVEPDHRGEVTVGELAAPALVIPESELVRRLLQQLRARQRTFAVVVDEYGGVAGIVTIEDLVEELVGEIEDEFDPVVGEVRRVGPGRYLLRGTVRADRLEELVGLALPQGEYETVAGFVIDRLGHIPAEGEQLHHEGWRIEVTEVAGVRVAELSLEQDAAGS